MATLKPDRADVDFSNRVAGDALSREVEARLIRRAQGGDTFARETVVRANARMAMMFAHRYARGGLTAAGSLDYGDLLQEAMAELSRCIDGFRPDMGTSFRTYAFHRIRRQVYVAKLSNETSFRLSVGARAAMKTTREAAAELDAAGVQPTPERIAEMTGKPLQHVSEALALSRLPQSFDAPVKDESELSLGEVIPGASSSIAGLGDYGQTAATPEDIALLRLRHEHGLTGREISKLVGIPAKEVWRKLTAARERLGQPDRPLEYESANVVERVPEPAVSELEEVTSELLPEAVAPVDPAIERARLREGRISELRSQLPVDAVDQVFCRLTPGWQARLGYLAEAAVGSKLVAAEHALQREFGVSVRQSRHVVSRFLHDANSIEPLPKGSPSELREAVMPVVADRFARRLQAREALHGEERAAFDALFVEGKTASKAGPELGISRDEISARSKSGLLRVEQVERVLKLLGKEAKSDVLKAAESPQIRASGLAL